MCFWSVGEKNLLFIKKKREYKGKEVEKRQRRENFHCPGKNINLEKGERQKYPILGEKHTPEFVLEGLLTIN